MCSNDVKGALAQALLAAQPAMLAAIYTEYMKENKRMARRVFFSFHFEHDSWRANQVRNSNVVAGPDVAGFFDHSEYEEAKKKGGDAIERMILGHLNRTSVAVILIGTETANRPWVKYEIKQAIAKNHGLIGLQIHHLKNAAGQTSWA